MSQRTYLDFLEDIRDCLAKAQAFVEGMTFDDFSSDEKTRFAACGASVGRRGRPRRGAASRVGCSWRSNI